MNTKRYTPAPVAKPDDFVVLHIRVPSECAERVKRLTSAAYTLTSAADTLTAMAVQAAERYEHPLGRTHPTGRSSGNRFDMHPHRMGELLDDLEEVLNRLAIRLKNDLC